MRIVVVGAGYAGTIAANRPAAKVRDAEVTVINPRADFVERVCLHQQIAGTGSAVTPLADMLASTVSTIVGVVEKISDGAAVLHDGSAVPFDRAIVAVGSTVAPMRGTIPVGTCDGAESASAALADLSGGATVTVVGAGLTGIETATEVAEARPDLTVRLVGAEVAASLSPSGRKKVRRELDRVGIDVVEDSVAQVRSSDTGRGEVVLASGRAFASDLTLWAVIADVPPLIAASGLATTEDGRAVVDESLRSVTDDRVFVVGDCAAVPGARFACATATPQGAHAANSLIRIASGREPKAYSMGYAGQALSLGRRRGILQMTRRDDTPRRMFLSGRVAAVSKELINRYAKYGSRTAHYAWLPGPRRSGR